MAAESCANVYSDATLSYSDIPALSTAQGLRLLNLVHRELVESFRIDALTAYLVVDAVNREFSIPDTYLTIWKAEYIWASGNTQPTPIYETSKEQLDVEQPGWQTTFKGIPTRYYVTAGSAGPVMGFDLIPPTATTPASSVGFPIIRYDVSEYVALTAGGNIPSTVKSSLVYTKGLVAKWAALRGKPDLAFREADYQNEMLMLAQYLQRKERNDEPRMLPFIRTGAARI